MPKFRIQPVMPGQKGFEVFEQLPKSLYETGSQRFVSGNEPVETHLNVCFVLFDGERAIARCAYYENPALSFEGKHTCTVGSFECTNDPEASNYLLQHVCDYARARGNEVLIGPMEGSTWNNYRFSDHNRHPNFFMEPYHHDYYGFLFEEFGFHRIAHYVSNLDSELVYQQSNITELEDQYRSMGATMRSLDLNDLDTDLAKIATFNNEAFSGNFLFTPIAPEDFVRKYKAFKNYFDPGLIWIVEDESGHIQALSFSIPDYLDPTGKTMIIKSLARKKDAPFKGIGGYLAAKTYQIAQERKYENVIHALMIHDNKSAEMSRDFDGNHYKTYSLYAIEL